jgi:adenosylmethionine---8-amino-7-oxononanoate aminotransferase
MTLEQDHFKQLDRETLWHPFTQMTEYSEEEPIIIERAEGHELIDIKGHRYLDGVSSLWVNVHGHRHPQIDQAIKDQLDRFAHSTLLGVSHVPALELAEELVKITPPNLTKVFYSDNGSTAVEIALKMAFQSCQQTGLKKKTRFICFENGYHGDTIGSVSVGGIDLFHEIYHPLLFEAIKVPYGDAEYLKTVLAEHGPTIAALVIEPLVQGAGGMVMAPSGFLKKVHELCTEYDVLMIADEVATGFGRTGKMFACEHEDVQPDFMTVAKGVTGGYLPLAVTLTTQAVYATFEAPYTELKAFFHGHSYSGNALACAAALANLKIFREENLIAHLAVKIAHLKKELTAIEKLPVVKEVRQCGMMVGIELDFPFETRMGNKVILRARDKGVIIRPLGNVIVLMPPLSMTPQELTRLCQVTYDSIQEVTL